MWLSENVKKSAADREIELGFATAGGGECFVRTDAEHRNAEALAPGGYFWRPAVGQNLLVIKCGGEGGKPFVLAQAQAGAPADMRDGEVYIRSNGGASIFLRNDGSIALTGRLYLNGLELGPEGV